MAPFPLTLSLLLLSASVLPTAFANPAPFNVPDFIPVTTAPTTGSDNCDHSALCAAHNTYSNADEPFRNNCIAAYSRYDPDAWYSAYTSYVHQDLWNGGCTAIFTCANNPYYISKGSDLIAYFEQIYQYPMNCQLQQNCGSKYFSNGQCRVTLNYCLTCKDVNT